MDSLPQSFQAEWMIVSAWVPFRSRVPNWHFPPASCLGVAPKKFNHKHRNIFINAILRWIARQIT